MTERIDHIACSSLLRPLVAGELDERSARAVRDHLESCELCRAELGAVRAVSADEGHTLTDVERTRLERDVLAATRRLGTPSEGRSATRRHLWGQRLVPALAAAATLAVIAVGAANLLTGASDGGDQGAAGLSVEPGPLEQGDGGADTEAASVGPRFLGDAGEIQEHELGRLAAAGPRPPEGRDPGTLGAKARLDSLAARAPGDVAAQIRLCAREVVARRRLLLPTFAATGSITGRRVVVVGFTLGGKGAGRYLVWAWPRGSCAAPVHVEMGSLPP